MVRFISLDNKNIKAIAGLQPCSLKMSMRPLTRLFLFAFVLAILAAKGGAQELTPRAYWPAPRGTRVAVLGYSYTYGDILTDPSLPIAGVDSRINQGLFAYVQTLSLGGRTANLIVDLPYTWGTTAGSVEGESSRRDVSGIADIGITLSFNLLGAPSMTPVEFQQLRKNPHSILGASLKIVAPTGSYEPDKLINAGANRWAVKTELGYMIPLKPKWLLEIDVGAWFFADNHDFLGVTREQKPVIATQLHLVRRFKAGFWAALDLNFFSGGRSIIGGEQRADLQRNSRFGGTIVYPFGGRHALKAGFSMGVVTASGGDFKSLLVTYQALLK
jgi:hypothetical protein